MTGDELCETRKRLNLKQEELAEKLGVAANTVSRWERNDMAIPSRMLGLALKQIEAESKKGLIRKQISKQRNSEK